MFIRWIYSSNHSHSFKRYILQPRKHVGRLRYWLLDNDFTVVGDDGSYLQAERVLVKGNTVVTLYVRYPSEQREKFDKESAEIMKSLQFN